VAIAFTQPSTLCSPLLSGPLQFSTAVVISLPRTSGLEVPAVAMAATEALARSSAPTARLSTSGREKIERIAEPRERH
jgi:hypothetical protein